MAAAATSIFVATNTCLLRQNTSFACRDKTMLVVTKLFLSRQNYVCRDRSFVATKMILVAAPASGNQGLGKPSEVETNKCGMYNKRLLPAGSEPCTRPGEKRTRPFVACINPLPGRYLAVTAVYPGRPERSRMPAFRTCRANGPAPRVID